MFCFARGWHIHRDMGGQSVRFGVDFLWAEDEDIPNVEGKFATFAE